MASSKKAIPVRDEADLVAAAYARLIQGTRHRPSRVRDRTLEEEADADRGRIVFSPAFRRLQNKAQVFSLERNASIRSRLTHSLEVASLGRYVTQQAIKTISTGGREPRGIFGKKRAVITFVEAACLLHDIGNPPFGHFGENAISDWFDKHRKDLQPDNIGAQAPIVWNKHYEDFCHFDGNPQGFRIVTKLQVKEEDDLCGLNLSATTLASIIKYPWGSDLLGVKDPALGIERKKPGYYHTEEGVITWLRETLDLSPHCRHPFAYLMEAADDIAYCLSDIEDGIEKRLFTAREMALGIMASLQAKASFFQRTKDPDLKDTWSALCALAALTSGSVVSVPLLRGIEHFRSGLIRYLVREAASRYRQSQYDLVRGVAQPLLRDGIAQTLLGAVKHFAETKVYVAPIVRDRELTANAVLHGLLDKYYPLMLCRRDRFDRALKGQLEDARGQRITEELGLLSRLSNKGKAVYRAEVGQSDAKHKPDSAVGICLERIYRLRLFVDYIAGMTDDYALQMFRLVSGIETGGH
jgi:dGTPase